MASCAAPGCDRPIPDVAFVCAWSETDLASALHAAADLWPELETTIAGLARMADPGPRARGRAPAAPIRPDGGLLRHYADQADGWPVGLPVNLAASEVADAVRNVVTTWARLVWEERGGPGPTIGHTGTENGVTAGQHAGPTSTPDLLRWLARQLGWLRYQPYAGEAWDELGYACGRIAPAVDRPRPRVDAGLCLAVLPSGEKCQRRLSASPGAAIVHCPGCRATHDATQRREAMLAEARQLWARPDEIAQWLTILGVHTTASMVRNLAARDRILDDGAGRYLLRDVERCRLARLGRSERMAA